MPKGKSAKDYKQTVTVNRLLGIIMLIALIVVGYFLFNFLKTSEILDIKTGSQNVDATNTSINGKKNFNKIGRSVKDAADLNKKTSGL